MYSQAVLGSFCHITCLIKIKYFRSVLSEVENHIDWKGRVQEWQNKYGSRYDYSINVMLSFFQTFEEQKKVLTMNFFANKIKICINLMKKYLMLFNK